MQAIVVCDRADEAGLLGFAMRQIGLTIAQASDLEDAMRLFTANPADLWVLALRKIPLVSQVRRVRKDSEACLTVIATASGEDEICEAFESGADDVIARPYSLRILSARFKALLRRSSGTTLRLFPSFSVGGLTLDPSTRTVHVQEGASRRLTHLEFRLLHTLMIHHGQTLPAETIVEHVWGYDGAGDTELVRGLVRRLRSKVESNPGSPQHVLTVPGVGYRLDVLD